MATPGAVRRLTGSSEREWPTGIQIIVWMDRMPRWESRPMQSLIGGVDKTHTHTLVAEHVWACHVCERVMRCQAPHSGHDFGFFTSVALLRVIDPFSVPSTNPIRFFPAAVASARKVYSYFLYSVLTAEISS